MAVVDLYVHLDIAPGCEWFVLFLLPGDTVTVIGAYTQPRAGYTLLAWLPAACTGNCPVQITDTATMTVMTRKPMSSE